MVGCRGHLTQINFDRGCFPLGQLDEWLVTSAPSEVPKMSPIAFDLNVMSALPACRSSPATLAWLVAVVGDSNVVTLDETLTLLASGPSRYFSSAPRRASASFVANVAAVSPRRSHSDRCSR